MVFDALSNTVDQSSDISTGFGGMLPIGGGEDSGSSLSASLKDDKVWASEWVSSGEDGIYAMVDEDGWTKIQFVLFVMGV